MVHVFLKFVQLWEKKTVFKTFNNIVQNHYTLLMLFHNYVMEIDHAVLTNRKFKLNYDKIVYIVQLLENIQQELIYLLNINASPK